MDAERALVEQQRRSEDIFETAGVALVVIDLSPLYAALADASPEVPGRPSPTYLMERPDLLSSLGERVFVRDVNAEAVRLAEASDRSDIIGPIGRHARLDRLQILGAFVEAVARGGEQFQRELVVETLKGRRITILVTSRFPPRDPSHVVLAILDVTERRRLEEQVRAAQRMEAMGRLAGGIAHDFNNLLTAISNYAAFLIAKTGQDAALRSDAEVIADACQRASALTRQLLTFSRREVRRPMVIDPNDVVTNLTKLLRRIVGEDIELVADLGSDVACVEMDPSHFEQVVMNLVVNARDAMPDGGRIVIRTRERTEPNPRTGAATAYVCITVSDSGVGMDPDTLTRIFEPYFTTKDPGKGTGLGLATVREIASESGGHVSVESAPGKGATFDVFFPRTDRKKRPLSPWKKLGTAARGDETVLVVEDQDLVRRTTRRILESAGFSVIVATNGAEGIQVAREHVGPIGCVLTDVVMPGISVLEALKGIREVHPEARVVFTSGYAGDALAGRGVTTESVDYLPKPFSAEALLLKVREVLDRTQAG